ncbi:zinc finger protein ZIPIC-like [Armigeres subalbatus]|uniref:zinc finger protein ZIPIC-like n=1 Tax=Armigeres subalbatus TaxID=124917 RepID=UPI002ED5CB61
MTEESAAENTSGSAGKRSYTRRSPLCRLCLLEIPKNDLQEIFYRGSDWKKRIFRATGIKVHRNDPTTRLCSTCRIMLDLIVSFQEICENSDLVMRKGAEQQIGTFVGDGWTKASELIESLWRVVAQRRETVMMTGNGVVREEVTETKQEIVEVSVPPGDEVYLDEARVECDERKMLELEPLEIKKEEEESVVGENEDDGDYQFEEEYVEESDQEESEEEEKPKRKRDRRKANEAKQRLKSEKVMCDTCGALVSQICLEGHLNRHLGVKPFVCEIEGCGRRLYSKYSLQQHRHLHKSIMRYYDCEDCGKRIKGTSCWMRHRKLHTEEPKHECDVCGKKFRRKFGLRLHSVVHTGVALFPCEICGKRFTVKHNLGAHYKMHKRNGTYPVASEGQMQE